MPNLPTSSDEMLQVFDETGRPTQALPRSVVKAEPRQYWHGVTNIWLINQQGEILCTRRSPKLYSKPGLWQSYVGGHVKAGQTFLETAIAEAEEEVGVVIDPKRLFLIGRDRSQKNFQFFENSIYPFDGTLDDLTFNDGEIVDARWMTLDAYFEEEQTHPELWCNGIRPNNEPIIREWIARRLISS